VRDVVHGQVEFQNKELDDLIIARSDGTPTYNFCVVVDDADMGVTHVIRGDDHLNNTPRQMNMLLALGKTPPAYAHVPMILGPDGAKLSKRHGAVSVLQYQEEGFLPAALLNYLVRLGWSHGDEEFFTLSDMVAKFDVNALNKAASAINPDKLLWLNQQHLMKTEPAEVVPHLRWHLARLGIERTDDDFLAALVLAQRERSKTLKEMAANSRFFFGDAISLDPKAAEKHLTPDARQMLRDLAARLAAVAEWTAATVHNTISAFASERGLALGKVAQPLRVAVSGGTVSPPIDQTLVLLGRSTTLSRIAAATG
jgi:glutamyl-tRNA synthetase